MDAPDLDAVLHLESLRGLRRINALLRSAAILWPEIAAAARRLAPEKLRVLDLACGGGDNAIAIARRGARQGLAIEVAGCDKSPLAIAEAQRLARASRTENVSFFPLDVVDGPLPGGYHVVTCSLFLHHLTRERAVDMLRKMAAAAGQLVLASDLRRTRVGYALALLASRLLTRSPVVRFDAPASVAAAFTIEEVRRLAAEAGWQNFAISKHWPQRYRLSWRAD